MSSSTSTKAPKTGVKDINFVGNHVFSSGKLRDLMQTTEMNWLSFFKSSDVYDPDKISADLGLDPPLLSEERLCRFPHRRLGRAL